MLRVLIGYALMYIAFDAAGRLLEGLGLVVGKSLTALIGIAAALLVSRWLHGGGGLRDQFRSLGWGRPEPRVAWISIAVSAALLACMPLIFSVAGAELVLPDNWLLLALGIFLVNGLAEETIYRGYLFARLRHYHRFGKAVLIGTAFAALAHLPIIWSVGPVVGVIAIGVSTLTFLPFAFLYERGSNTIWAPAIVHFAADCILPLGALGLTTPLVLAYWMGAQVVTCYVAAGLVYWTTTRQVERSPLAARAA